MSIAKIVSIIGLVLMTVFIGYGIVLGDFGAEGAWIVAHPWGQISLVDVYTGITLFSMWVIYRESSLLKRVIWIIVFVITGNWATALYTLLALHASNGDWQKLFHGDRAR
jgi:Protein of unknown function (DUF1475)